MNKEEFIGKLQMVYVGDKRASKDIISEYDRLNKEYERIYNENCKLREEHNITDIKLLDENNRLKNIINELEKYIHNELVLDFYNDDMPCELIINKMEKMIKELKENK